MLIMSESAKKDVEEEVKKTTIEMTILHRRGE